MTGKEEYVNFPIALGSGGYAIPQATQQTDRGDLIDKIKPEAVVEMIKQKFLGNEFVNGEWKPVAALENSKLSEIGAYELSNLLMGVASIATSVSKYKDHEIRLRALSIAKTAQTMAIRKWKIYHITSAAMFPYIHEVLFSVTFAVLKQADDASIQDLLKGTSRYTGGDYPQHYGKESTTQKITRMLGLRG